MEYVYGALALLWWAVNTDAGAVLVSVVLLTLAVRLLVGAWVHRVQSSSMYRNDANRK